MADVTAEDRARATAQDQARQCLIDHWPVTPEADRVQWEAVPLERVGPLRFGAGTAEAVAAMREQGYRAGESWNSRFADLAQIRIGFRRPDRPGWGANDVDAWFVDTIGLTCVAVHALSGPQVTLEGIRLIGRVPSELLLETAAHLIARDGGVSYTVHGEVTGEDWGMMPRPHRAGDRLLTGAVFGRPNARAGTMYDCVPFDDLQRATTGLW
ncbi:hypothetical protein [Kitasatospora sp. NPDC057198]|uniref:hypothetical protein n=1 Tax=Kitasatospora sp. NPDC057198 TaxID=3346046 RepID=UPI00363E7108